MASRRWPTLSERRESERQRKRSAVDELRKELPAIAKGLGDGVFYLFGSAARGQMRWDSDVDILVDFGDRDQEATGIAEEICSQLGIPCQILEKKQCKDWFLEHISKDLERLG